jgi:hypothetical protein
LRETAPSIIASTQRLCGAQKLVFEVPNLRMRRFHVVHDDNLPWEVLNYLCELD